MMVPIDDRKFDWIRNVDEILSKANLEITRKGDRIVSDYDIVLSHISSNLSIIYTIAEAKPILNQYRKAMEKIASNVKKLWEELLRLQQARIIAITTDPDDKENYELVYLLPDNTILADDDVQKLQEAYQNLQEAFRQLARAYLYTLISAIEMMPQQEEQVGMQVPNYNIPMTAPQPNVQYYFPPAIIPAPGYAPAQKPGKEGER